MARPAALSPNSSRQGLLLYVAVHGKACCLQVPTVHGKACCCCQQFMARPAALQSQQFTARPAVVVSSSWQGLLPYSPNSSRQGLLLLSFILRCLLSDGFPLAFSVTLPNSFFTGHSSSFASTFLIDCSLAGRNQLRLFD